MKISLDDLTRMHDRGVLEHFIEQNNLSHNELLHTVVGKISERDKDWKQKVSELQQHVDELVDVLDNPF